MDTAPKKGRLEEEIDAQKNILREYQKDYDEIKLMDKNKHDLEELKNSNFIRSK